MKVRKSRERRCVTLSSSGPNYVRWAPYAELSRQNTSVWQGQLPRCDYRPERLKTLTHAAAVEDVVLFYRFCKFFDGIRQSIYLFCIFGLLF